MGCFVFGFGILGGILFSVVLTYYPEKMTSAAYIICVTSFLCLAFFYAADVKAIKSEILVACSLLGFCLLPILFVAYELAVMQTAPLGVSDSMSCGLINVVANILGFIVAISLTPALDKETKSSTTVTFAVLFINLAIALLFLVLGSIFRSNTD